MKLRAAALSIVASLAATPALAQYWYAPGPYAEGPYAAGPYAAGPYEGPYGGPRPYYAPGPYGYERAAPYDVMAIVRSANLRPISRPWRNGANFVVRATNARGAVVRVVVDAYRGRILAIAPADTAPVARLAPEPRINGTTPQYDENGEPLPPRPPHPASNAQRPATERNRTAAVTPVRPPLPRPRPADAPAPVVAVKPAPVVAVKPASDPAPAAATTPAPPTETTPQPVETPTGVTGSTVAAPTGAGSGAAFPPVTPLE